MQTFYLRITLNDYESWFNFRRGYLRTVNMVEIVTVRKQRFCLRQHHLGGERYSNTSIALTSRARLENRNV